jgi:hypothetical protein
MTLYDDLRPEKLVTKRLLAELNKIVNNSPQLLRDLCLGNKKMADTYADIKLGEDADHDNEDYCKVNFVERHSGQVLISFYFSGMSGLCSTVVAHDSIVIRHHPKLTKFMVKFFDSAVRQSNYSCLLYTLTQQQEALRKILEERKFRLNKDMTHTNKRSGNTVHFLYKHYHQSIWE